MRQHPFYLLRESFCTNQKSRIQKDQNPQTHIPLLTSQQWMLAAQDIKSF